MKVTRGELLDDRYWAGMIDGRLVHQHVTLVEPELAEEHARIADRLAERGAAASRLGSLNVFSTVDRAWLCHLAALRQLTLPEAAATFGDIESVVCETAESRHVLLLAPASSARTLTPQLTGALEVLQQLRLTHIVELGAGVVVFGEQTRLPDPNPYAVRLPDLSSPSTLPRMLLFGAARNLAALWMRAERRAYGSGGVEGSGEARLADAFGHCAVAELTRRALESGAAAETVLADLRSRARAWQPTADAAGCQLPRYPLTSELLRCWWPAPGRAQHIFDSPFDYMDRLEKHDAHS